MISLMVVAAGLICQPSSAGQLADVVCSYKAGKNPNTGYTDGNAILQPATSDDDTSGIVSLGQWEESSLRGSPVGIIVGFSTSIANLDGNDLLIVGNAMTSWYEPGYVEVAMETSGSGATADGWEDETFYLLKPSNYDQVGDPRTNALSITWDQTAFDDGDNPYTDDAWSDQSSLTGYADVTVGGDAMDISWAIDASGESVTLSSIAYIRIRTVTNSTAGTFGYFSTDLDYIEYMHVVPEPFCTAMLVATATAMLIRRRRF